MEMKHKEPTKVTSKKKQRNETCFNENSDTSVLVAFVGDRTGVFGYVTAAANAYATAPDPYAAAASPYATGPDPHSTGPLAHPRSMTHCRPETRGDNAKSPHKQNRNTVASVNEPAFSNCICPMGR